MKGTLLACVWCADGREVRRALSHKSHLGFSREQQVLQANLEMHTLLEMCTRISRGLKQLSGPGRRKELEVTPSSSSTRTSPDLSCCIMKWLGELNQLENSVLSNSSWVIFHLENFPTHFTSRSQKCLY